MPEHTKMRNATFRWAGDVFTEGVHAIMTIRVMTASEHLRNRVIKNLSVSSRSFGRSKPGQFPRADTGRLRNSIFKRMVQGKLAGQVGTNLNYGLWLEYGTKATVILPVKRKVLSWIDPTTGKRVYARRVMRGAIKGRSFLRRTLWAERPKIASIMTAGLPANISGSVNFSTR